MGLCADVREHCAAVARRARWVAIDEDAIGAIEPGPDPSLDPERHFLEGSREDVAAYFVALDAINFGSGWFPTLRKRPGCSGYFTIASALAERWREAGPWTPLDMRALDCDEVAAALGQDAQHELIDLYTQALRDLGRFLGPRTALEVALAAGGSAERLAETLARRMRFFDDRGFYKRAQILPSDLARAGVVEFRDLDELTIFADNLVPHVLRVDGVLRYDERLAARIDAGELLSPGEEEREIRACAVHACVAIARRLGIGERDLDNRLWTRGQEPRYKERPRHRTRTVYY